MVHRRPPRGYDQGGFAREPFIPYQRPPMHRRDRWEAPEYREVARETAAREPSDTEILDAVCEAMTRDGWITSDGIQVSVQDGVVTLRGEVGDYLEARYAWDDAWETEGVRGVINHLTVRTDPSAT